MKRNEQQRQDMPREKSDPAHAGQKPRQDADRAPEHGADERDEGRREFGRDG